MGIKFLDLNETEAMARAEGFPGITEAFGGFGGKYLAEYLLPNDFCRCARLSNIIKQELIAYNEVLFWFLETDVWECESNSLAEMIASYYDVNVSEMKRPFLIDRYNLEKIDALMSFAMYSSWGFLALPSRSGCIVSLNHDSVLRLSGQGALLPMLRSRFVDFEMASL